MPQGSGNFGKRSNQSGDNGTPRVVDFNQVRTQKLEEKRRTTERIFFKHLLNVYSVVNTDQMMPIEFIDVSDDGCSFQVPYDPEKPWPTTTSDIPLRVYFSQDTYLEIRVTVQNSRPSIENNRRYVRYGCTVDTTTASYAAYQQFVRFLKLYSEHAHKDMGDVSIFYL
ncbi:MAG: PilZ domain-containing protein [Bdellovibrionia bacterium]